MTSPYDPNHFIEVNGELRPAPWMQWRQVASVSAKSKTGSYNVTGGGNKDELLHNLATRWRNTSPVPQNCYGLITRGGARVTLQARSRGGLLVRSGYRREHVLIDDDFETLDPRWTLRPTHTIVDAAVAFSGKKMLQIGPAASAGSSTFDKVVPVSPGDKVRISFQARKDAAFNGVVGNSKVRLAAANNGFAQLASVTFASADMPAASTWYPRTLLYTVPADGSVTSLGFTVVSDNTAGNAWLDKLNITVSPEADPGTPLKVEDSSIFGVGGDLGRGGLLAVGTTFAMPEVRMNAVTFPVAPERVGWARLDPGEDMVASVELRFITQLWEFTTIDGGDSESESGFETGDTRLDLFALPII